MPIDEHERYNPDDYITVVRSERKTKISNGEPAKITYGIDIDKEASPSSIPSTANPTKNNICNRVIVASIIIGMLALDLIIFFSL